MFLLVEAALNKSRCKYALWFPLNDSLVWRLFLCKRDLRNNISDDGIFVLGVDDLIRGSCCNITTWHASAYRKTVCSCFLNQLVLLKKWRWSRYKGSCSCSYLWYHAASLTATLQVLLHFHPFSLPLGFGRRSLHHQSRSVSGWNPKVTGPPIVEQVWDKKSLLLIISVQLSMTSVRVSWAGLLETSVCADFIKVLFQPLMFWLLPSLITLVVFPGEALAWDGQ